MLLVEFQKQASRTCPTLGITNEFDIISQGSFLDKHINSQGNAQWHENILLNSIHMTAGMVTEFGEMIKCLKFAKTIDKVNLQEELADKLWYFVNYALFYKIDLNEPVFAFKQGLNFEKEYEEYSNLRAHDLVIIYATDLLDFDKKELAYKKQKNPSLIKETFINLFKSISDMFYTYGLDASKAMTNVIDKLKVRYPNKFTEQNANNRNLEAERLELEK